MLSRSAPPVAAAGVVTLAPRSARWGGACGAAAGPVGGGDLGAAGRDGAEVAVPEDDGGLVVLVDLDGEVELAALAERQALAQGPGLDGRADGGGGQHVSPWHGRARRPQDQAGGGQRIALVG